MLATTATTAIRRPRSPGSSARRSSAPTASPSCRATARCSTRRSSTRRSPACRSAGSRSSPTATAPAPTGCAQPAGRDRARLRPGQPRAPRAAAPGRREVGRGALLALARPRHLRRPRRSAALATATQGRGDGAPRKALGERSGVARSERRRGVVPSRACPRSKPGERVGALIAGAAPSRGRDVLVVSQKVVSKAEGRVVGSRRWSPARSARARRGLGKEPAPGRAVLAESRRVVRAERGVLITETHGGWICANAGIDTSNLPGRRHRRPAPRGRRRLRPPAPRAEIGAARGRPARGGRRRQLRPPLAPRPDRRRDRLRRPRAARRLARPRTRDGRELEATEIAVADEVAAAADLARDKDAGLPAVVIRGLDRLVTADDGPGAAPSAARERGPLPLSPPPEELPQKKKKKKKKKKKNFLQADLEDGGTTDAAGAQVPRAPRSPSPAGTATSVRTGTAAPARGTPRRRAGSGWRPSRACAPPRGCS